MGLCYTYGCPGAGDEHLIRVDLGLLEEVCYQSTVHLLSSKIVEWASILLSNVKFYHTEREHKGNGTNLVSWEYLLTVPTN